MKRNYVSTWFLPNNHQKVKNLCVFSPRPRYSKTPRHPTVLEKSGTVPIFHLLNQKHVFKWEFVINKRPFLQLTLQYQTWSTHIKAMFMFMLKPEKNNITVVKFHLMSFISTNKQWNVEHRHVRKICPHFTLCHFSWPFF